MPGEKRDIPDRVGAPFHARGRARPGGATISFLYGTLLVGLPQFTSYALYRWEYNIQHGRGVRLCRRGRPRANAVCGAFSAALVHETRHFSSSGRLGRINECMRTAPACRAFQASPAQPTAAIPLRWAIRCACGGEPARRDPVSQRGPVHAQRREGRTSPTRPGETSLAAKMTGV